MENNGREDSVDEMLEELEENEKQRLEDELAEVESVLEDREKVHDSLIEELDQEIRVQKNRLASAPNRDQPRIRDRLEELYRERREELRSSWRDCESWLEKKLELERQLDELEQVLE